MGISDRYKGSPRSVGPSNQDYGGGVGMFLEFGTRGPEKCVFIGWELLDKVDVLVCCATNSFHVKTNKIWGFIC